MMCLGIDLMMGLIFHSEKVEMPIDLIIKLVWDFQMIRRSFRMIVIMYAVFKRN